MYTRFIGLAVTTAALTLSFATTTSAQQTVPDPRTVPELQSEFARAEKMGLPVEPLVAMARKGYWQDASDKQIRDAVRGYARRIERARTALRPARPAEMLAGADALNAGVPERVLKSLRAAARTRSIEVPLGVLTELVSRGVPVANAAESVETLLKREALDAQMIALGNDVLGDVAAGVAPTVALDIRSQGVLSLLPAPGQAALVAPNRR
jgi:hypothetical protein